MSPRSAARLLLALRLLPALCALALTCVLVPAYFQWEGQKGSETVGVLGMLAATAGIAAWVQSLVRSSRALLTSSQAQPVLETSEPFLALAGIVRPRIIVSRGFLDMIPADQREVAMRHEMAHFRAADNLKRLLMLLAPPVVPGWNGFAALEDAWARYAERAADDCAVAGDPARAALLAAVLVSVARACSIGYPPLASTLVGSAQELKARVERLFAQGAQSDADLDRLSMLVVAALLLLPLSFVALTVGSKDFFHVIERLLLDG